MFSDEGAAQEASWLVLLVRPSNIVRRVLVGLIDVDWNNVEEVHVDSALEERGGRHRSLCSSGL